MFLPWMKSLFTFVNKNFTDNAIFFKFHWGLKTIIYLCYGLAQEITQIQIAQKQILVCKITTHAIKQVSLDKKPP